MNNRVSFMTMTATFLWPRWGVRSYPIVTRGLQMSACRQLLLLISIIGRYIRIWPSIRNQFVIASYLAVAEHQIVFSLHSVSCKKPPTSECIQFFFYYTRRYMQFILLNMNLVHGITLHILYSIWIYIHTYGNRRLIVSDTDSLTFIAQSPEECVRCIWNLFCYRVWFHEQSTT